ncbi:unnamed protein product [Fraxinus pennsylvanica]|uniref:DUF7751 domain-containing protein n=1 Tax=Fraxinus pennsylvanica TaxID=56036 RepID=A0AAD1ZED5_9LAMI|nr:unnamed protein product [Fraxinus pennsylvanica]
MQITEIVQTEYMAILQNLILKSAVTILRICDMCCDILTIICDCAEKVVGWALWHHLTPNPETDTDAKFVLSTESIQYGIGILQAIQNESKSLKKSLKMRRQKLSGGRIVKAAETQWSWDWEKEKGETEVVKKGGEMEMGRKESEWKREGR